MNRVKTRELIELRKKLMGVITNYVVVACGGQELEEEDDFDEFEDALDEVILEFVKEHSK